MRPRSHRGWSLGCLLLAACPNNEENTGSATQTTTGVASTGAAAEATGPATSTGETPTSGATGEPGTTGEPTSGTTTGTTGDPLTDCETQFAELAEQTEKDCTCLVAEGSFPDQQACLAEFEPEPVDCLCPILTGDPANAAVLACVAAAEQQFTACVTPIACDDFEAYAACSDAYFETTQSCGPLSKPSLGQTDVQCHDVAPFMCTSGESVPFYYECDMEPDCKDMSDESEATCTFTCGSGEKVPKDLVCDESPDCMDGSDEAKEMCVFVCEDGGEVPKGWVCDGEPDCMDGSDEAMCLGRPLTLRATGSSSAGTRPRRDRRASPAARAAAWRTR